MTDKKGRFDPDEIFNIKGSWLNLIEAHSDQLAGLEKRMGKSVPLKNFIQTLTFQTEFYGAQLAQLAKAAGVKLDPHACDYAEAYAEAYVTQKFEHDKSEDEANKAADRAGVLAKAKAIAADVEGQTKPRLSRAAVVGETVES